MHSSTKRYRKKTNPYLNELFKQYPNCKHDEQKDEEIKKYNGHKITYGEMNYEGIDKLYEYVKTLIPYRPQCFVDIGSGRGKLCLYMAEKNEIQQVLGVELVTSRYDDGMHLKTSLGSHAHKVQFLNMDVLKLQFRTLLFTAPVFVWFSNLCFDQTVTDKIYAKVVDEFPIGTLICSSKPPSEKQKKIEAFPRLDIPMSWNKNSSVHVYLTK